MNIVLLNFFFFVTSLQKKSMPDTRREDLFKELENYDRLEVKLKKLKSEQLDQDGMFQEKVLHNLRRKYGDLSKKKKIFQYVRIQLGRMYSFLTSFFHLISPLLHLVPTFFISEFIA